MQPLVETLVDASLRPVDSLRISIESIESRGSRLKFEDNFELKCSSGVGFNGGDTENNFVFDSTNSSFSALFATDPLSVPGGSEQAVKNVLMLLPLIDWCNSDGLSIGRPTNAATASASSGGRLRTSPIATAACSRID